MKWVQKNRNSRAQFLFYLFAVILFHHVLMLFIALFQMEGVTCSCITSRQVNDKKYSLLTAVAAGHLDCAEYLIGQGCDLEVVDRCHGRTALLVAVAMGHSAIAESLIKAS